MTAFEIETVVAALLREWGWGTGAPDSVRHFARRVAEINPNGSERIGEIVYKLGYASREKIEASGQKPEARELYFNFMARLVPQLRRNEAEVMAVKRRMPFYVRLPDTLAPHPLIAEDEGVRNECENIAGLLAVLPSGAPCLVFSSHDEMLRFQQRGSSEEARSALAKAFKREGISPKSVLYAFAPLGEVMNPLRASKKDSSGAESGHAVGRLFYMDRTRGAERSVAVDMLETGVARKATDLSMRVLANGEGEVHYRENGKRLFSYRISVQERIEVSNYLMTTSGANPSNTRLMSPKTGRLLYKGQTSTFEMRCSFIPGDLRQAVSEDDQVVSISMRYLEQEQGDGYVDIDKLNFTPEVKQHLISALNVSRGILLLVGPTNSGKSTTLAAFLSQHYKIFGDTVKRLSLEDPKERTIIGVEQFSLPNSDIYEEYLEGFLRHDPDVILFSEIRSRASAEVATRAANTGHLVLSTFHATEPVEGYTSLAHLMSDERQLDLLQALVMIITQRLVPWLCPACSIQREPTEDEWAKFRYSMSLRGLNVDKLDIRRDLIRFATTARDVPGHKCDTCNATGYIGVYPVHGILDFTKEVKALLRAGKFDEVEHKQSFTLEAQALKALHLGYIELSAVST
jgi:type II secretory ATPase GspE/PulE/Tfp pilus assembly ATPase PilB-like protein